MPAEAPRDPRHIDPLIVDRVAVAADCDRRTAAKALRGETVRGRVAHRVNAAIKVVLSSGEPTP